MDNHIAVMLAEQINASAEASVRVAGMQAENEHSVLSGNGIVYAEEAFDKLAVDLGLHHNFRCDLGRF